MTDSTVSSDHTHVNEPVKNANTMLTIIAPPIKEFIMDIRKLKVFRVVVAVKHLTMHIGHMQLLSNDRVGEDG